MTTTSSFTVDADGHGGACPSSWPASVSVTAGVTNPVAGALTSFTVTASRQDRTAPLTSFSVTTPPGLSGFITAVPLCPQAAAESGTCPASSQVGTTTVGVGVGSDSGNDVAQGSDEEYLSGNVYLTGPPKNSSAPFGLSIVVTPIAGPFNLSSPFGSPVVVLAAINVDPHTAQLTIAATLPTTQDGIPLHIRTVNVTVNRPGFIFNPTNCSPLTVSANISGASVTAPFQVAGCQNLPFKPTLTASTSAVTSTSNGASLDVIVKTVPGGSNLHSVGVTLPSIFASRATTVLDACAAATYDANPASCPATSLVGTTTAVSPILPGALTGPVYIVSHGGAGLPTLEVTLNGDGVTIAISGTIGFSASGQTISTFASIPDVPISSFELSLPEGPHSAVANTSSTTNLCGQTLTMPTTLVAQDGATIDQTTPISIVGCGGQPNRSVKSYAAAVHGHKLFVRLDLAKHGTLTVTGRYVKRYERTLNAGGHRIKIALTKQGIRAARNHHQTTVTLMSAGQHYTIKLTL